MVSTINTLVAREHVEDLVRTARERRVIERGSSTTEAPAVELRLAAPDERRILRRLADLDDAAELEDRR